LRRKLRFLLIAASLGFYVAISVMSQALGHFHTSIEKFWAIGPVVCVAFAAAFIKVAESTGKTTMAHGFFGKCLFAIQGMGTLTYCIYVFHPEIFIRNGELLPKVHSLRLSLIYFPSIMLQLLFVAALFYMAVEKPFELKKRGDTPLFDAP
jgi:peptidoglycan/LPS O-acetylase OafA/YrhL